VLRGMAVITGLRQDIAFAVRTAVRAPASVMAIVITLALGLAVNAVMFDVVDRLLLSPPAAVGDPAGLSRLGFIGAEGAAFEITYGNYVALRDHVEAFESVAGFGRLDLPIGRGETAWQSKGMIVTPSFFTALEVRPALGRFFLPQEERIPEGDLVAVISYGVWQREYAGERTVLGRQIEIRGRKFTIVGVAPRGFSGVDVARVDIWIPYSVGAAYYGGPTWYDAKHGAYWTEIIVRRRAGREAAPAEAEAAIALRRAREEIARVGLKEPPVRAILMPIAGSRNADGTPTTRARVALWLSGFSLLVLLIAIANVSNLVLARTIQRRRELGIRFALGGTRARVARLLMTESLMLAAFGFTASLLVATAGTGLVRRVLLADIAWDGATLGARVAFLGAAAALVIGVIIGVIPILQLARREYVASIGSQSVRSMRRGERLRGALLLSQATLVTVLLVGAGLFIRSLERARATDLGFDATHVLVVTVQNDARGFGGVAFWDRAYAALRGRPGLEDVSVSLNAPFGWHMGEWIRREDDHRPPETIDQIAYVNSVSEGYFHALGMHLRAGREFTAADAEHSPRVVIVSETLARTLWPGRGAVGQCMIRGSDSTCSTVVGVLADTHTFELREKPQMQLFMPIAQGRGAGYGAGTLVARTTGEPAQAVAMVRRTLLELEPGLLDVNVRPLPHELEPYLRPWRLSATVFEILGPLALAVAGVGLYGLIAFGISRRSAELAVRSALGASPNRLTWFVLREGLALTFSGLTLGILIALSGGHLLAPLLYDVEPSEPAIYVAVAALLLGVALLASARPAWSVAHTDPAQALRAAED
jgi:predicted permease